MSYNNICVAFIFIIICTLCACAYNKGKTSNNAKVEEQAPKTIFLNFELTKQTNKKLAVKLLDKIVVDGAIKKNNLAINKPKVGDLKCVEFDSNEKLIQHFYLSNPLNKRIEYVNDDGELSSKNVELETVELAIRMQLHTQTKTIALEQITNEANKSATLTIVKLN